MKYMLMFWVDESAETTPDQDAANLIAVKSWVEKMAEQGVRRHGGALRSVREGKIVRIRDDELLVSDGPYAETKEQVGGYDVIECADLEVAIQLAAGHPLARAATVEVRPFWDAPWKDLPDGLSNAGVLVRRHDDQPDRRQRTRT
jgi:hypothetical protein